MKNLKLLFIFMIIFTTSSVLACVDLTGFYECSNEDNTSYIETITQTKVGGHYQIHVKNNEEDQRYILDQNWHDFDMGEDGFDNAKYMASCTDEKLYMTKTGSHTTDDGYYFDIKFEAEVFFENGKRISIGTLFINDQTSSSYRSECKKL